jgi:endonuclease/exonuclease/phosphatase family metal-dependent hydrolase
MKRFNALILGALLAVGCREAGPTGPAGSLALTLPEAGARGITVFTRNVYLGADLEAVIVAPLPQLPVVVAQTFATIQASNFAERAVALADEIVRTRPHLVGLQEVELYRVQSPGDAIQGGTIPATVVAIDFLALLQQALADRGASYVVAAMVQNFDAELPAFTGVGFDDIRLTDRDVILARHDVAWSNPLGANYTVNLPINIGGQAGAILRGWTSVDATVGGTSFRFFNTHLETQLAPPIQVAQAQELLAIAAAQALPAILVGDFNSDAGGGQTPTYDLLTGAGYRDTWLDGGPDTPGFTCCHDPDLRNETSQLSQRLDLILAGNGLKLRNAQLVGGVQATVLGDDPADRTPSGLWPSDHAGVVATLHIPGDVARR